MLRRRRGVRLAVSVRCVRCAGRRLVDGRGLHMLCISAQYVICLLRISICK